MFLLKYLYKVSVVALPILWVTATTCVARAEGIIGRLFSVHGAVQVVRGGKTLAATNGMAIEVHDKVVTLAGGSVTILMPDHSAPLLDQFGTLLIDESMLMNDSTPGSESD